MDILYLDQDLCISKESESDRLFVHTKSKSFNFKRRVMKVRRLVRFPFKVLSFFNPFKLARKIHDYKGGDELETARRDAQLKSEFAERMDRINSGRREMGSIVDADIEEEENVIRRRTPGTGGEGRNKTLL